jgi:N6-adenosine-specific RNA methylase IME4
MWEAIPDGTIRVVYADPPWWVDNDHPWMSAGQHYSRMSLQEIHDLSRHIQRVTNPRSAACFLWGIGAMLPEAISVLTTWGFEYRTMAFVWAKRTTSNAAWSFGGGFYTRLAAEFVLLGIRGTSPERLSRGVRQLLVTETDCFFGPRSTRFSEKPAEIRQRVAQLFPGPYFELFARAFDPTWYAWGDEVPDELYVPHT